MNTQTLALALLTLAGAAQAADGPTVYNQNCAMCHVPEIGRAHV